MPTFKQRRGTAATLASANETPAAGQIYFEIDTNRIKIGTGTTPYNSLPYLNTNLAISSVVGLQAALDGKQAIGSYAAAVHVHTVADVTGLQAALDGKQAVGSYAASVHSHTAAEITDFAAAVVATAPPTTDASLLTSGTLPDARLSANIARTSDISAAVTSIIDAAPAALDTLNELAAALNDDASFATTVTTALAGKANVSHTHSASEIVSGTIGIDRLPVGSSSTTVCAGNDARLSDSRAPSGAAGGDLTGTYPSPSLANSGVVAGTYTSVTVDAKGRVTAGSTPALSLPTASASVLGAVRIGSGVAIDGDGIISVTATGGVPSGAAGGDLAGSYPNPTLASSGVVAGTYTSVTVDAKGRVTAGTNPAGYSLPVATTSVLGGVRQGNNVTIDGSGIISVATPSIYAVSQQSLSASTNDFAPGTAPIVRLLPSTSLQITGMAAGVDGQVRVLYNAATSPSAPIDLMHASTASAAANRFAVYSGVAYRLLPQCAVTVIYDGTSQVWRVF